MWCFCGGVELGWWGTVKAIGGWHDIFSRQLSRPLPYLIPTNILQLQPFVCIYSHKNNFRYGGSWYSNSILLTLVHS